MKKWEENEMEWIWGTVWVRIILQQVVPWRRKKLGEKTREARKGGEKEGAN